MTVVPCAVPTPVRSLSADHRTTEWAAQDVSEAINSVGLRVMSGDISTPVDGLALNNFTVTVGEGAPGSP
eukprot:9472447-Pyramimonas_sp.AAC.1